MSEFQGVAISEAPLLFRTLLLTGATVVGLVILAFVVAKAVKRKKAKTEPKNHRWLRLVSGITGLVVTLAFTALMGVHATRHWLDYGKKDYCVYTGSYEVRAILNPGRHKEDITYEAVLPDGHRIDISTGDVGYTTGTLVYTARTNILLGYDDSIVIKPET